MLRLRLLLGATLATLLLLAPVARANLYTRVLQSYEAYGSVPACQFSSQQLETALKEIDTYGQQYFADFSAAVQNALAARASGVCTPVKRRSALIGTSSRPLKLGPLTAATGASLPAPVLALAGLAVVLGLFGVVAAIWWWRGWDPAWAARWRHAFGEAGYRASGTAADFDDWLGSG